MVCFAALLWQQVTDTMYLRDSFPSRHLVNPILVATEYPIYVQVHDLFPQCLLGGLWDCFLFLCLCLCICKMGLITLS